MCHKLKWHNKKSIGSQICYSIRVPKGNIVMIIDKYNINSVYSDHDFTPVRQHFAFWASYNKTLGYEDRENECVREDRAYRYYDV